MTREKDGVPIGTADPWWMVVAAYVAVFSPATGIFAYAIHVME